MKPIICVTQKEYDKTRDIFEAAGDFQCIPVPLEEDRLAQVISETSAFGCIIGVDCYRDRLYEAIGRGGIIARFGVGHDGVDKRKAAEHGIIVTNTPGVLDNTVAEHAILLMGCFARRIAAHQQAMREGQWRPFTGSELRGKRLLIVGCGSIGRKTARIASQGFGMEVAGYDIADLDGEELRRNWGFADLVRRLPEALKEADYVSFHIPSISATRHFVNRDFLSDLKPSCVLINTARGAIVDESALYDALASGRIAGAAMDVFENEPYVPVDPGKDLRTLDNVLLTPHVGSSTVEACRRMALGCLKNIRAAYEKNYSQLDILNPDVLSQ